MAERDREVPFKSTAHIDPTMPVVIQLSLCHYEDKAVFSFGAGGGSGLVAFLGIQGKSYDCV